MTRCERLDGWLDQGRPGAEAAGMEAHAVGCPRCAAALSAALELEAALRDPPAARAPVGFADAVMARVATAGARPLERAARGAETTWVRPLLGPWTLAGAAGLAVAWLGAGTVVRAAERLAAAVASAAAAAGGPLLAHEPVELERAAAWWLQASAALPPVALTSLALAAAGAATAAAWALARWSEHAVVRRA